MAGLIQTVTVLSEGVIVFQYADGNRQALVARCDEEGEARWEGDFVSLAGRHIQDIREISAGQYLMTFFSGEDNFPFGLRNQPGSSAWLDLVAI